MPNCNCCGKTLSRADSIKRGMGEICYGHLQEDIERGTVRNGTKIEPKSWDDNQIRLPEKSKGKVYKAVRGIINNRLVICEGSQLRDLPHIMYHSPDGFEWGYGGSGPSDLARSILYDVAGLAVADRYYQLFKEKFLCHTDKDGFTLKEEDILNWLRRVIR